MKKVVLPQAWKAPIKHLIALIAYNFIFEQVSYGPTCLRDFQPSMAKTSPLSYRLARILSRGQKFHLSARNYEWNLERTSNSYQSNHPTGRVLWEELRGSHITCYSLMFFIAYTFKGQVHVLFAGQVKIVSHSSCRLVQYWNIFVPC